MTSPRPLRTYEGVWLQLKQHKKVVLTVANSSFVERIKRMISKEKDMDDTINTPDQPIVYRLSFRWNAKEQKLYILLTKKEKILFLI